MKLRSPLVILLLGSALAGCMVGPNYKGAPNVAPNASAAAKFAQAGTRETTTHPAAKWWLAFKDPELTRLIELAIDDSPAIDVAEARVKQARGRYAGERATLIPSGSINGIAGRGELGLGDTGDVNQALQTLGGGMLPTIPSEVTGNVYSPSFDALWELDIFGGNRRAIQGAMAKAEMAGANLADAHVQVAAEVGQAYVSLRAAQKQLAIVRQSVDLQEQSLKLMKQQQAQGTVADLDISRLETQLSSTRANIPLIQAQIEAATGQIDLLCGQEPGSLDTELRRPRAIPMPPRSVAVGNPADMLRRRPDIRAAERQLAAANSQIGQAIAAYFPKVTLAAVGASVASDPGDLFNAGRNSLLGGPVLQWNILSFKRIDAQVSQAKAGFEEAEAGYKQTVLAALQDAEQSLSEFRHRRDNVIYLARAEASASKSSQLMQEMQKAGTVSVINVLDVERQRLQTEQGLAQARAGLTNSFISLQKSLGLGWEDAPAGTPTSLAAAGAEAQSTRN